jgi:hypothetical protein
LTDVPDLLSVRNDWRNRIDREGNLVVLAVMPWGAPFERLRRSSEKLPPPEPEGPPPKAGFFSTFSKERTIR